MKIINETTNGKIFKCATCEAIHIEFRNLNFNFDKDEFIFFKNAILKINGGKWEDVNADSIYNRKIMVPIGHKNFNMLFHKEELAELQQLLRTNVQKNILPIENMNVFDFNNIKNLN